MSDAAQEAQVDENQPYKYTNILEIFVAGAFSTMMHLSCSEAQVQ